MSRALRLVIGFSPGSASDIIARTMAPGLERALGCPVVIESRLGANGAHAAELVSRAASDGSVVLVATLGTHAIAPVLQRRLSYDPLRDFAPVALLAKAPLVVLASNSLPVSSIHGLVELARSRPGELTFGSSAIGGAPHLAGALFSAMAGVRMQHRPYAHTADLYDDLAAGRLALTFNNIMSAVPLARAGKARALAVTPSVRSAIAPDLPTIAESGLAGYDIVNWLGLVAPAGTHPQIVDRINEAAQKTIDVPDMRARLLEQGMEPAADTSQAFAAHMRLELEKWGRLIDANRAAFEIDL
jgi:tripartite-type tricarboxylate transporter receptor subunit TctC